MPELEVTMDVYEQLLDRHSRQLDREERDHIAAMKAERDYYNKLNPQGAAGGAGFLDTIIKSITGKGVLGAGIAAGGVAGGIMILADVIKNLTKESKILSTVQDTVGKALGLLVDLVLLPFLPLLIFGIFYLYTAIIGLGKIWNDYIKNPAAGVVTGPAAVAQTVLGPIGFDIGRWIGENFTDKIIQSLIDNYQKWKDAAGKTWDQWVDAFNKTWKIWSDAFWKTIDDWKITFSKWWDDTTKIISDSWKKVSDGFEENFVKPIKNALNVLRDKFVDIINWVIDKINMILPPGLKLDNISKDYTDAGVFKKPFVSSSAITVTNNFNGFTLDQLPGMVDNALRQAGDRLSSGSGW